MLKAIVSGKESEYGAALRSATLISFCKFMAISSSFCEATLLVRSADERVRCNIVICIGDLCYRFPNQCEQWTSRIYGTLRDEVGKGMRFHG